MQIECQGDPTDDLPSDFKFFPDFSCHQGFSRPKFVEMYKESLVEARNRDERHSYDGDDETKLERCSKYWMLRKLRITGEYSIHRELSKPDTYFVPEPPNETLGSFGDELRNKWIGKIREDCQDPFIGTMIMDSKHCTDPDIEILYNCISKSVVKLLKLSGIYNTKTVSLANHLQQYCDFRLLLYTLIVVPIVIS
ncbi:unnamed protein product [Orchesella dallaii]|uniref:Uncharacterized protein n=1 Tax=Orchesella dallaii TaxID=48710 RepID=A0ABP1S1M0_9HEXA